MKTVAVFISGSGSNLQALIDATESGHLDCKIGLVVSNKPNAYGLERAAKHGIPTLVKSLQEYKKQGKSRIDYDIDLANQVIQTLNGPPTLIVLAGFMHILSKEFIEMFPKDSIINLHPALPGCFDGAKAIPRALEAFKQGEIKHTGVMIHKCIPEVDRGEVIVQEKVDILESDTLEDLENRIHEVEHKLIVQGTDLALMLLDGAH